MPGSEAGLRLSKDFFTTKISGTFSLSLAHLYLSQSPSTSHGLFFAPVFNPFWLVPWHN